ncbi:hypothetical protein K7X08_010570 [Anisodus acutangulus]|uniref:Uncharacterized protein n=1 Tax=Anisodus acutangulus TaxID=402998 RepID=A0A9Q1N7G3_9SOLA|nr:hypothetical protein K7X08_010570 [Anisodus acutangulus]
MLRSSVPSDRDTAIKAGGGGDVSSAAFVAFTVEHTCYYYKCDLTLFSVYKCFICFRGGNFCRWVACFGFGAFHDRNNENKSSKRQNPYSAQNLSASSKFLCSVLFLPLAKELFFEGQLWRLMRNLARLVRLCRENELKEALQLFGKLSRNCLVLMTVKESKLCTRDWLCGQEDCDGSHTDEDEIVVDLQPYLARLGSH